MLPVSKQFVAFRLLEVSEDSVSCVLIACKIKNQAGFWPRLSPEIIIIPPYQKLNGTQPGKAVRRTDHKPAAHSAYPSNISRVEPDPGLFRVPPGYQVIEETGPYTIRISRP
jgi:hypothetical protein